MQTDEAPSSTLRRLHVGLLAAGTALIAAWIAAAGWMPGWSVLQVPAMTPVFGDMRVIQAAIASVAAGQDPQVNNVGDAQLRPMNYPLVWLHIATALGLDDETRFLAFTLGCVAAYLACCAMLLRRWPSLWLLALFFSSSGLMLVERGNIDLVIFALLFAAGLAPQAWLRAGVLFVATALKLYPVFAVLSLVRHRKAAIALVVASALLLLLTLDSVQKARAATPVAMGLSYGLPSLALAVGQLLHRTPPSPWLLAPPLLAVAAALLAVAPLRRLLAVQAMPAAMRRLFMVGASVYLLTFLFSSNWDYRLVVLALCVPYLQRLPCRPAAMALLVATLLAANQQWLILLLGRVAGGTLCLGGKLLLFVGLAALLAREVLDALKPDAGAEGQT